LSALQFDLRAQGIDGRNHTGFQLIGRPGIQSLRRLHLGLRRFDASRARNRLQICVARHQNDQLARILIRKIRRLYALGGGALLLNVVPVEHRLVQERTNIHVIEWPKHTRENGKPQAKRR